MYCSVCGAKCKKEDLFCGECGTEIKREEKGGETQKVKRNSRDKVSRKNRMFMVAIVILIALLCGCYQFGNYMYSPKIVASRYIKAIRDGNADALYQYLEVDEVDTTFVTKKVFQELTKEEKKSKAIENYKITDVTYGSGKLSATVSFKYTTKGNTNESTGQIYLMKQSKKNLLLFDDWKVNNSNDTTVIKDYTLKVPVGSKVTYAGIEVTDKYLENNNTKKNSSYDIYILPQVFALKTKITATLANGIKIEENVTPSNRYGGATLSLTKGSLSDDVQQALNDKAKEVLTTLYGAAIERKAFGEIKDSFERKEVNVESIEKNYQNFVSSITSESNQLTKIDFKDISIYNLETFGENLKIRFKVKYDYTVKYKSYFNDEEKTHDGSTSSYMTLILGINGSNDYYLVDFEDLITYFSKY